MQNTPNFKVESLILHLCQASGKLFLLSQEGKNWLAENSAELAGRAASNQLAAATKNFHLSEADQFCGGLNLFSLPLAVAFLPGPAA